MATTTTRLLLRKPDPNPTTGDLVNVTTDISDSMDKLDATAGFTICTSGTRPTGSDRWDGRQIYETDTRRTYMWASALTAWLPMLISRGASGPYLLGTSTDTGGEGFNFQGSAGTAHGWRSRLSGDTQNRFSLDAAGRQDWGPGGATVPDLTFARTGAAAATLTGGLTITGNLTVQGVTGYKRIYQNTLGVATNVVTSPAIPGTFDQIYAVCHVAGTAATQYVSVVLRLNGDSTAANYDSEQVYGSASIAGAGESLSVGGAGLFLGDMPGSTCVAGSGASMFCDIPAYAGTVLWKLPHSRKTLSSQTSPGQAGQLWNKTWAHRWKSTAAVTTVEWRAASGNFIVGSRFYVYLIGAG